MWECPDCGYENKDETLECETCGCEADMVKAPGTDENIVDEIEDDAVKPEESNHEENIVDEIEDDAVKPEESSHEELSDFNSDSEDSDSSLVVEYIEPKQPLILPPSLPDPHVEEINILTVQVQALESKCQQSLAQVTSLKQRLQLSQTQQHSLESETTSLQGELREMSRSKAAELHQQEERLSQLQSQYNQLKGTQQRLERNRKEDEKTKRETETATLTKHVESTPTPTKSFSVAAFNWDANWNDISSLAIEPSGLRVTNSGAMYPIRANQSFRTGRHSWKVHCERASYLKIGVVTNNVGKRSQLGADSHGWALYNNGQLRHGSSSGGGSFSSGAYSNGTIIRVELDLDSRPRTLSFTLASDKQGSGSVKKAFDLPEGEYWPAMGVQGSCSVLLVNAYLPTENKARSSDNFKWDTSWNRSISNLKIDYSGLHVTDAGAMYPIRANQSFRTGRHSWKVHFERANYLKIGVVTNNVGNRSQLGADSYGWALYTYNGQLRHGSSSGGGEFDVKYSAGTIIRVELDLDSRPRTLSFTLASDKQGSGSVKKAFDLPEGEYWPAMGLQHSTRGAASVRLLFT